MARGFSEQGFWQSLQRAAVYAGREVVEKALTLYFAAQRPETPVWAKTVIYSALAYFILPADAIPDFVLLTGYVDDLGTLAAALGAVAMAITPEVKAAAKQKVTDWFGDGTEVSSGSAPEGDAIREIVIE
ncbi:DUF1232 domain-containing protein [Thermoleptolyngbya sichuanensis A183]|uniref:DUF1232 domain-containing protein n=1 Tax=Thermoleptolyngbya sichuanensis A183 TaxID=2737172 RepID=A0A6M8BB53_9CYAN|nr:MULTISPECIES: YkvA family protein [Thermoleptolyngbya]MDG2617292.1 YkvA family protein [Thermoleptolyngbya sichuanensis XZ-Cy5]QKD83272.1 DUF1232 domain-containing protein [Thermoleptolyngbya sichuanensis A183]